MQKDIQSLEVLHLTDAGFLTNTGKAASELCMPIEQAVIMFSAALLGVGAFASRLCAAASSESLLEGLSRESEHPVRSNFPRFMQFLQSSESKPGDLLFLAHAIEEYEWNAKHWPTSVKQDELRR